MDIAKYIGLYLLKNKFCYIHGLGNLQIVRKAAVHDGTNIQPPQYEVQLSPLGSVDDSFANFIATNEQISIAAAANALRDFSTQARVDLNAGKEIIIPSIGKFVSNSNGTLRFITDENLSYQPQGIPVITKRVEEEPSFQKYDIEPARSSGTINWGKIIILSLIALVVIGGITFGIIYLMNNRPDKEEKAVSEQLPVTPPPAEPVRAAAVPDTTPKQDTTAVHTAANGNMEYQVVLNTYDNLAKAEKRKKQLEANRNVVNLITKDSATYFIVVPVAASANDTAHVLDSLRRFFNPKGVYIYRP